MLRAYTIKINRDDSRRDDFVVVLYDRYIISSFYRLG